MIKNKILEEQESALPLSQHQGEQPVEIIARSNTQLKLITRNTGKETILSTEDFSKSQINYNLTQITMIGIASAFYVATNNKKMVKSNLKKKFSARSYCVDSRFDDFNDYKLVHVKSNLSSDASSEVVVHCTGLSSFINYIDIKNEMYSMYI